MDENVVSPLRGIRQPGGLYLCYRAIVSVEQQVYRRDCAVCKGAGMASPPSVARVGPRWMMIAMMIALDSSHGPKTHRGRVPDLRR